MPVGKRRGLVPTLIVLLVVAGVLTILGILVWLRLAPKGEPTQPGRPRSGSSLQVPPPQLPNRAPASAAS